MGAKIKVIKTDRRFGLLICDLLKKMTKSVVWRFTAAEKYKLPAVKSFCGFNEIKQDAKAKFSAASKLLLPLERKIVQRIDDLSSLGKFVSVVTGVVENCSPVVWMEKSEKL